MPQEGWQAAMDQHERDEYAHAPILLALRAEMTELQKLGWQIRGGLIVLGAFVAGGALIELAHLAHWV
jgi:hypothetical protein